MRKNFLLLMLMALMSLAGYASTDINEANFSVADVPYGTAALNPGADFLVTYDITLTKDTHYTWDEKYYSDQACSTEVTLATSNVGTYYVKITGKGAFEGSKVAPFKVIKRPINVTLKAGLTKVYGAADPALTDDNINWLGAAFQNGQNKSVFSGSLTYTYDNGNVGAHALNVTGYTADNYTLNITGAGLTITPKPISPSMITQVELTELYKAAAYTIDDVKANIDVKDGSTPLVAGTDFELDFYTTADVDVKCGADPQTVGKVYLGISQKAGTPNYSVAANTLVGSFEITKAGLTVRVLPQTREYDGTTDLPKYTKGVAYEIIGAQGADEDGFTAYVKANFTVKDGDKPGTPAVGTKNVTVEALAGGNVAQYDINYVPSTLTITKKTGLKLTANDFQKVYGEADNAATGYRADYGWDGTLLSAKAGKGYAGVKIEGAVGTEWQAMASVYDKDHKGNGGLEVERTNASANDKDVYPGVLNVKYAAAGGVWANYDMENVQIVTGKFTITGGKVYVTALNQKKNYGEADPDWTADDATLDGIGNYIVTGLSGSDKITGVTLTRVAGDAVKDYVINIAATGVPDGYEDIVFVPATFTINKRPLTVVAKVQTLKVGDTAADLDQNAYTIANTKADEGLVAGDDVSDVFTLTTANTLTVAGKFLGDITVAGGIKAVNYTITPVDGDLIVIDPDATIVLNRPNKAAYTADPTLDDAATVIAAAATAKYTKAQANAYAVAAGLSGAVLGGWIKIPGADAVYYTKTSANTYNAANVAGCHETGYTVVDDDDANAINAVLGDGVVAAADNLSEDQAYYFNCSIDGAKTVWDIETPETHVRYTDDTAYDVNVAIEGAVKTTDARPTCVTFGDFAMKAEKWYPIVLPFATSVKEVSETFGYAIVDILKEDNTDKTKIAFKLHMGDIPANTPFVVKVYEDMNMNEVTFGDPGDPYVTGKSIVNSAAPKVKDASGVEFIGSYSAKTDGFRANEAFFVLSAEANDYYWGSASNTTYMVPLAAFFRLPANSSARTIEFEEADGTVTAIKAVNAEVTKSAEGAAEGWYTINGVKLNAKPTQKGLYIFNGKKVAIK